MERKAPNTKPSGERGRNSREREHGLQIHKRQQANYVLFWSNVSSLPVTDLHGEGDIGLCTVSRESRFLESWETGPSVRSPERGHGDQNWLVLQLRNLKFHPTNIY